MSIFYMNKQNIGRSGGRLVIGAAAYISGERLCDNYYNKIYNYTNRRDVVYKEIFLPDNAPIRYADRAILWNAVETSEKRHDARTAHEFKIALPKELTPVQNIELIREYVKENFVTKGMIADIAVHDKGTGNPHTHILLTTRNVNENGFTDKNRDWNRTSLLINWRKTWAEITNKHLERYGFRNRIDHRTLIEQGIDREPTIHEGLAVRQMAKRGIETDRSNKNRAIEKRNKEREEQKRKRYQERINNLRSQERERGR